MEPNFLKCSKCGHTEFLQLMMLQRVPAIMSQTGKEGFAPLPGSLKCAECGDDIINQLDEKKEEESKIVLAK